MCRATKPKKIHWNSQVIRNLLYCYNIVKIGGRATEYNRTAAATAMATTTKQKRLKWPMAEQVLVFFLLVCYSGHRFEFTTAFALALHRSLDLELLGFHSIGFFFSCQFTAISLRHFFVRTLCTWNMHCTLHAERTKRKNVSEMKRKTEESVNTERKRVKWFTRKINEHTHLPNQTKKIEL